MEFRSLKYFWAVAKTGSMLAASEMLHVTEPTLSRQINSLEQELGARLFKREVDKRLTITPIGTVLLKRVQLILNQENELYIDIAQFKKQPTGKVRIGVSESNSTFVLNQIIKQFHQKYPFITFDLIIENEPIVERNLKAGRVDFALADEPIERRHYELLTFKRSDEYVLLCKKDDSLASKASISINELTKLPLIMPARIVSMQDQFPWFNNHFSELNVVATFNSSMAGLSLLKAGLGYMLTIKANDQLLDFSEYQEISLRPALKSLAYIFWKRDLSKIHRSVDEQAVSLFATFISDHRQQI